VVLSDPKWSEVAWLLGLKLILASDLAWLRHRVSSRLCHECVTRSGAGSVTPSTASGLGYGFLSGIESLVASLKANLLNLGGGVHLDNRTNEKRPHRRALSELMQPRDLVARTNDYAGESNSLGLGP
jgi:hypothetical protein